MALLSRQSEERRRPLPGREMAVLLAAARFPRDPDAAGRLGGLIDGPVDEPALLELARSHGMLTLLSRAVSEGCARHAAGPLGRRLAQERDANARGILLLCAELARLLRLLVDAGIRALPYKGPVLALQAYGDVTLRRADDLDLFVTREEAWRAAEILAGQGFRPEVPLPASQWSLYLRSECDRIFLHPAARIFVELHWQPVPPCFGIRFDLRGALARARTLDLAGTPVPAMAPEDQILLGCIHAAKHRWERLEWVCATASLQENHKIDWGTLLARAREANGLRALLLGLALARDYAAARLPEAIEEEIKRCRAIRPLSEAALSQLGASRPARGMRQELFRLKVMERLPQRVRYLFLSIVTPTYKDMQAVRLPAALSFLYFGLRPLLGLLRLAGLAPTDRAEGQRGNAGKV